LCEEGHAVCPVGHRVAGLAEVAGYPAEACDHGAGVQ
jgi:hypothetical protein